MLALRQVLAPYSHFDIPVIGQAYLLFRARLMPPYTHAPGVESLETALFSPEDIPFDQVPHALVQPHDRFRVCLSPVGVCFCTFKSVAPACA